MKAGATLLCLLWLAGATYAGYRMTARSFAWVDVPNFGLPAPVAPLRMPSGAAIKADLNALKDKIPAQVMEQAKSLSPQQLLCLRGAVSPAHLQAALSGTLSFQDLSAQESASVSACLK